ncbi:probable asparagine--tRNA ligase, mitochondrial isoform X2 [Mercenaria mercenaria]|uniref:probable asparagine--tRNA ligase, mitochondrial isoform X2 n=1 Tax=Mercenaria mercenaria TaxID=6596 RepID=UPI00234F538A|nr:probable asparagine--tRNA ligase, mitochondrial isoform X2 [Mercenaria mercenaria]
MHTRLSKLNSLQRLCLHRRYSTGKQSIYDIFNQTRKNGRFSVSTEGWIKSFRKQKKFTFFHLNDGTCVKSLQVVADSQLCDSCLSAGCSVRVEGDLVRSLGPDQAVEVQATNIQLIGECDNKENPLKPKSPYSLDFTRQYLHLRPRTEHHGQLLRLRNTASMAIHKYFQDQGYIFIHTPILSSNDCEGAGETFSIETDVSVSTEVSSGQDEQSDHDGKLFFGHPTYLTVSGQLHLETITGAFRKAYNFGPTFRAENSVGRHHLAEFYMIEAEIAFTENLADILREMESLVKTTCCDVLEKNAEMVDYFWKSSTNPEQSIIAKSLIDRHYVRMTYTEAIKVLERNNDKFVYKLKVAAVDLLVPEVGELIGGSLREERYDVIKSRLDELGMTASYQWYLDLRRYGSVTHGGFGMGFERLLQCFLGISNIKDTIPFPRWPHHCSL